MLHLSEEDLMNTQERIGEDEITDFGIHELDFYPANELLTLLLAVAVAHNTAMKDEATKEQKILDVWGYRLRDALKIASRRETELPFDI